MLYKFSPRPEYLQASDRILTWLQKHTYSAKDIPVKRGKGDATIATDTYAWSIAAIGPEKLKALGLDPDAILDYAEQHCRVEVGFLRPEGLRVNIKGFDFAPLQHSSRGGVVSAEWTAQMAIAFKTMADFYRGRGADIQSRGYQLKAEEYLSELAKMVISSDSPSGQGAGCLPYATEDYVDTGHGWITPRGGSTGSVAATAYTFFAVNGFNPLELK
jgi:hypothetical protein